MTLPLGKLLVHLGYAKEEHVEEALKKQREKDNQLRLRRSKSLASILLSVNKTTHSWENRRLGKILVEMGVVTAKQVKEALQKQKQISSEYNGLACDKKTAILMEAPYIINSALNIYHLLNNVMTWCNTLVDSTASALFICDENRDDLEVNFYKGGEESRQIHVSPKGSVAEWVIKNNEAILVNDLRSNPRFPGETEAFPGESIRSVACVPVRIKWEIVGAIEVINKKQVAGFSKKDLALLSTIANQVAITLDNIILLRELDQSLHDLRKAQDQIIQTEKLKAIGEMAGGIAHDFNNLLMGIRGNASLMIAGIDATHPHYNRLKNIENQVESGTRLTSHLLGYARKGRYEVKPIDLNQFVVETSETFGSIRKEITIHQELAEDLLAVEADSGQIEQILFNLYVNAADAMPGGGDLTLKTMNSTHKDINKLHDPKPGDYILLTVSDTGAGMDKKTRERIFDPFFTTKEKGLGTGLGLASAYDSVKGHGGYIDVHSKKGQGATFNIYLPASEKEAEKVVEIGEEHIKGTETVLLVDDEEVVLEVCQDLLEAMGHRVFTAKSGKEAIELYRENRDDIDIVLLDMVMPHMSGGEAYDRMKEINPDIKVLLSSGFSLDGQAAEILDRGCNGFIQKPFNMKGLSGKIRGVLDKK